MIYVFIVSIIGQFKVLNKVELSLKMHIKSNNSRKLFYNIQYGHLKLIKLFFINV